MLGTLGGVFAVVVCIAANAFFVAAELSLVTVRATWVRQASEQQRPGARALQLAKADLDGSLAATQLGITLASIALGWLGEPAIAALVQAPLRSWIAAHSVASAVAFLCITFLHVVLGELAPKAVALGRPERIALAIAGPLMLFRRALHPLVVAMNGSGAWVVRRLGFKPASAQERAHSAAELRMLLEESRDADRLDATLADVARRSLRLGELCVRDAMVPRARMQVLDEQMDAPAILRRLASTGRSRLPIWSSRRGRFLGVAYAKLLMLQYARDGCIDLLRASFAPAVLHADMKLTSALEAFLKTRQHLALVDAEDASIVGLLTLEDVLEELVGEIEDELDVDERDRMRPSRPSRASRPAPMPAPGGLRPSRPSWS